jgi:hypothetical protein
MRRLLLDAVVLEDSEAPAATVTRLQWSYAQLTTPATQMPNLGTPGTGGNKNAAISESFPYTVPAGHTLGIVSAQFACKISEPQSYLVVFDGFSLPGHAPSIVFPQPFLVPAGATLNACFINNSTWNQMMKMVMQAVLVKD